MVERISGISVECLFMGTSGPWWFMMKHLCTLKRFPHLCFSAFLFRVDVLGTASCQKQRFKSGFDVLDLLNGS